MESKETWTIEDDELDGLQILAPPDRLDKMLGSKTIIATVHQADVATLIAAAPELLAEIKRLRQRFVSCLEHSGTDREYALIAVAKTDVLIAKAEGRA